MYEAKLEFLEGWWGYREDTFRAGDIDNYILELRIHLRENINTCKLRHLIERNYELPLNREIINTKK